MKQTICILLSLFFSGEALAEINELQLDHALSQYFYMNRKGPELVSVRVMTPSPGERTLKLHIIARRHSRAADLGFAFAAAAAVANLCVNPPNMLEVQMDINYRDYETTLAMAPADCTIDAVILKKSEYDDWWESCLQLP